MELDLAIQSRRSARKYSDKKPDWRDIIEAIDAMRYAPMAGGMFTLKFILVEDKDDIQKLADASQQEFIATAQYVVVVCSAPKLTKNAYEEFADKFLRQQAGAAIQNFLLKCEELNLKTCWIGYFVEEQVKSILKIPENIQVEAMFPIGLESKKLGDKLKPRKKINLDDVLYFYKYNNKQMKKIKKLDV